MLRVVNYPEIAKYLLLSFLCFGSVFSATTTTATTQGDGEDEGIYGEDEVTSLLDSFGFTTTKRYIRADRTVPTNDPVNYRGNSSHTDFLSFFFKIAVHFSILMAILVCIYKYVKGFIKDFIIFSAKFHSNSSISSDTLTTVHRLSEQSDFFPEIHIPTTGRNHSPDSRRELCGEPVGTDLSSELDRNRSAADTTEVAISFINSSSANYSRGRRESYDAVTEMPPDYSTVVLNDLTNPTNPDFPVVKRASETPPPEYGKEIHFLNELP